MSSLEHQGTVTLIPTPRPSCLWCHLKEGEVDDGQSLFLISGSKLNKFFSWHPNSMLSLKPEKKGHKKRARWVRDVYCRRLWVCKCTCVVGIHQRIVTLVPALACPYTVSSRKDSSRMDRNGSYFCRKSNWNNDKSELPVDNDKSELPVVFGDSLSQLGSESQIIMFWSFSWAYRWASALDWRMPVAWC